MAQTKETTKESDFLMVKLPVDLKQELRRVLVEERGMDMSKATRQALTEWIAKKRKQQERRANAAAKNGS